MLGLTVTKKTMLTQKGTEVVMITVMPTYATESP